MVGEPLLRMGEDFMGVKLPVEMDPPRVSGLGLDGRGCASEHSEQKTGQAEKKTPEALLSNG